MDPQVEPIRIETCGGKKAVCVIGAGASGLTVSKELLALGHTVKVFDMNLRIGGVYTKSYDRTMLTTSSVLTAFSDYSTEHEDKPKFYTDEDYLMYLDGFATKFGLYEHIQFRTKVVKVTKCMQSHKWLVTVKTGAHVWPHRSTFLLGKKHPEPKRTEAKDVLGAEVLKDFYDKAAKEGFHNIKGAYAYEYYDHMTGEKVKMCPTDWEKGVTTTYAFDQVAVATGTNTWASLPEFKGQETVDPSCIVHSENYKKPEVYRGKRVLVIGAGESGSDICNEIASEASKVAIVVRNKHGHLIPRKQSDGRVTDLNTNRCRYSNPYILGDWVGWANQHAKKFVAKNAMGNHADAEERKILAKIGELNLQQKTSAFSKFGCKNEGFVTAMVTKGTELHRDAFTFKGNKAVFDNGEEFVFDNVVACTGYKNSFPFFEHPDVCEDVVTPCGLKMKDIACQGKNPRLQYKQVFHTAFPTGEIAFFGFARPAFGAIPPCAEMQSRMYAMVTNGSLALPCSEGMKCLAKKDTANYEFRFGYDAKRVKGLVDFQVYTDDMAAQMGSLPPLTSLFFSKPAIWWKIMFSSVTMHQYRFVGPYANPRVAEAVLSRVPVGDFLECSITAAFLITAKILSIIGFKDFTPNHF